ncbi:MAG TPA: histidinol-phosphatase, partial [Lysinibacillus sp.]|nr:histidinol-phosphatase [Lysinibacillus sp.]
MTIDYHVHLEEGPYSSRWLERTSQALEFFQPVDATSQGSKEEMTF